MIRDIITISNSGSQPGATGQ